MVLVYFEAAVLIRPRDNCIEVADRDYAFLPENRNISTKYTTDFLIANYIRQKYTSVPISNKLVHFKYIFSEIFKIFYTYKTQKTGTVTLRAHYSCETYKVASF